MDGRCAAEGGENWDTHPRVYCVKKKRKRSVGENGDGDPVMVGHTHTHTSTRTNIRRTGNEYLRGLTDILWDSVDSPLS